MLTVYKDTMHEAEIAQQFMAANGIVAEITKITEPNGNVKYRVQAKGSMFGR